MEILEVGEDVVAGLLCQLEVQDVEMLEGGEDVVAGLLCQLEVLDVALLEMEEEEVEAPLDQRLWPLVLGVEEVLVMVVEALAGGEEVVAGLHL